MRVFVDSGGWLSVLITTDVHHAAGRRHYSHLIRNRAALLTDYILDEVVTRLRYDVSHRSAAEFLALAEASAASGALSVLRVDEGAWVSAKEIFLRFSEPRLSFTDCTSFALLARTACDQVFGFDQHFEMMGHVLQPR